MFGGRKMTTDMFCSCQELLIIKKCELFTKNAFYNYREFLCNIALFTLKGISYGKFIFFFLRSTKLTVDCRYLATSADHNPSPSNPNRTNHICQTKISLLKNAFMQKDVMNMFCVDHGLIITCLRKHSR